MKKRLLLIALCIGLLSGCGISEDTTVVLTTGLQRDEVFRIEQESCSLEEYMIYLANMKNQYQDSFGEDIFNVTYEGTGLEDTLKGQALERLAGVKSMKLLAQQKGISLEEEELERVETVSQKYLASVNESEQQLLNMKKDTVYQMYEELALAQKVYDDLIADINPEISDDEARTISVQEIYVKTYFVNEKGERESISNLSLQEAADRMQMAYDEVKAGADFATIATLYSDDTVLNYSFGKGVMDAKLEEVAFSLSQGEISEIFETEDGMYILKCISTFNKEETDRNKVKIVEQRRKEVFEEEYMQFATSLVRYLNEDLLAQIAVPEDENITTNEFFQIYEAYINH